MLEPPNDLLRRPQQAQLVGHDARQGTVFSQFAALGTMRPIPSSAVSLSRPIANSPSIALDLAADRRRRSSHSHCDRTDRVTDHQRARDFLPLCKCQCQPRAMSFGRADIARLSQDASYGPMRSIKQVSDLMKSPASFPALPHQRLLAICVVSPSPVPHLQHSICLRSS